MNHRIKRGFNFYKEPTIIYASDRMISIIHGKDLSWGELNMISLHSRKNLKGGIVNAKANHQCKRESDIYWC